MGNVKIQNIKILHMLDSNPDTSWLGTYTDELGPGVIIVESGEFYEKLKAPVDVPTRGLTFRGFKPYAGGEEAGTADYYKYGMQDFERMQALNNGEFSFIGIRAVATVYYPVGTAARLEKLSSGGLWGIESDCFDAIREIEAEQLAELKEHLEQFGVDTSNFDELAKEAHAKFVDR